MLYQGCEMEWYADRAESRRVINCDVRIDNDFIKVEYVFDGLLTTYSGHSIGQGHYSLKCVGHPDCTATLHCFENSNRLEGSWQESSTGMWLIKLKK
jgi:hypothetical protein